MLRYRITLFGEEPAHPSLRGCPWEDLKETKKISGKGSESSPGIGRHLAFIGEKPRGWNTMAEV